MRRCYNRQLLPAVVFESFVTVEDHRLTGLFEANILKASTKKDHPTHTTIQAIAAVLEKVDAVRLNPAIGPLSQSPSA